MSQSQDENRDYPSRNFRIFKGVKFFILVTLLIGVIGWVFMHLWNWLVPDIFGFKALDFWHALGLLVLCRLLFGGRPGFFHRRGHWKHRMRARWESMSPEEREKFRSGMQSSWCQFSEGRRPARASGISQGSQRP
jgi:hypothetical protein